MAKCIVSKYFNRHNPMFKFAYSLEQHYFLASMTLNKPKRADAIGAEDRVKRQMLSSLSCFTFCVVIEALLFYKKERRRMHYTHTWGRNILGALPSSLFHSASQLFTFFFLRGTCHICVCLWVWELRSGNYIYLLYSRWVSFVLGWEREREKRTRLEFSRLINHPTFILRWLNPTSPSRALGCFLRRQLDWQWFD